MTEFSVMYTMAAGAFGALIAVYVILAALILLAIFALVRLGVLARRLKRKPKTEEPKEIVSKETQPVVIEQAAPQQPMVNCDECETVAALKEHIATLEERIRELETPPVVVEAAPVVVEAAPVAVVAPLEEKTLKESIAAARIAGKTKITKQSIAAYVREKYGSAAEVNERGAKTSNGKLPLSDNHFIYLADGSKVCFTYVYDTPEGGVVSLVRLDAERAAKIAEKHAVVSHSTFPKNKAKDWYSVVADDTFTEEEYYAIFDASIEYLRENVAVTEQAQTEAPIEDRSLKESLAAAKVAHSGNISKQTIIDYLTAQYAAGVEINHRGAKTGNGKLPLSDNHFVFLADGSKVCFTYVYDTPEGGVVALVRLDTERAAKLAKKHVSLSHSTFPKNKANDWYSVIADGTATEEEFYALFDESIAYLKGVETVAAPAPMEDKSLKESLASARMAGKTDVSKKSIAAYVASKYGDGAEVNERGAKTGNGKLPLSDNHFIYLADGSKVCFTYVYDTPEGGVVSLVRLDAARAAAIAGKHALVSHSTFPKNKANDWYSVIADGSFTEEEYYAVFDESIAYLKGTEVVTAPTESAPVDAAPVDEVAATAVEEETEDVSAKGTINKKSVVAYLDKKYLDKVELHPRKLLMDSGKLPVPDNHFVLCGEKRICFSYVYEDKMGEVAVLVRLGAQDGDALLEAHESASHSAFPRNKAKDWYKIVIDDTFTEREIYAILDRSVQYALSL